MPDHTQLKSHYQFVALTDMNLIAFEILKFENPANWLAKSIFAFNHAHLKLHDHVALIDMTLHAKTWLYTSILVSEILKFLKPLWACLGMPDHTQLNLHNGFITLINMKLHA